MKLFLDIEFTRLNRDAKLISLALVAETGEEFYVELSDGYSAEDCSDFVIETVLPQLDLHRHGQTVAEANVLLQKFFQNFDEDLEVCSDAPAWDWPLFCQLARVDGGVSSNVLLEPTDLSGMCRDAVLTADLENLLRDPPHHALADAKLIRDIFLKIQGHQ